MIVLDANIFAKLFVAEHDSASAKALMYAIQGAAVPVSLPGLFTYEIVQIGRYHNLDTDHVLDLLHSQFLSNWQMVEPARTHWKVAQKISQKGHAKSGYPAMYDSIYHALAIEGNGAFITADKKHYEKAKSFGHIYLLEDWKAPLEPYRTPDDQPLKAVREDRRR
jgi:predicted nucleic acid-binding protein